MASVKEHAQSRVAATFGQQRGRNPGHFAFESFGVLPKYSLSFPPFEISTPLFRAHKKVSLLAKSTSTPVAFNSSGSFEQFVLPDCLQTWFFNRRMEVGNRRRDGSGRVSLHENASFSRNSSHQRQGTAGWSSPRVELYKDRVQRASSRPLAKVIWRNGELSIVGINHFFHECSVFKLLN